MYFNVCSLLPHVNQIREILKRQKPRVLLLSETCLTKDIEDFEVECSGYVCIRCDSKSRHTGGVVMYIKSDIKFNVLENSNIYDTMWILTVKISIKDFNGSLSVLYRSPSTSVKDFITYFNDVCENIDYSIHNVICGDFNIDMLSESFYKTKMTNLVSDLGLKLYVTEPTRTTISSATLIDYVLSNNVIECKVLPEEAVADHSTIVFVKNSDEENGLTQKKSISKIVKYSDSVFREKLRCFDWSGGSNNIDEDAELVQTRLVDAIGSFIKKVKVNPTNDNKWYNANLSQLKRDRDNARQRSILDNTEENWNNYKMKRNLYVSEMRETEKNYMMNQLGDAEGDNKKMWKLLKSMLQGTKKNEIKLLELNGSDITDKKLIANTLNEFFVNSVEDINQSIPSVSNPICRNIDCENIFELEVVSQEQVSAVLMSLNSCMDPKFISPKHLLDAMPVIGSFYTNLINESISKGKFPKCWKESTVIPVPKTTRPKRPEEFRPINNMSALEKPLEKIVKEQLIGYVEANNILSDFQSGYRRGYSCESALNLVLQKWKEKADKNEKIVVCFLDMKRAFETIDRGIMLQKLARIGVGRKSIEWFESYLEERQQRTKVDDEISMSKRNNIGVPQGSILGAFLFILYINDVHTVLENCCVNMFADDTLIYLCGENIDEMIVKVNSDLNRLFKWLCQNKLKLNIEKTKYMIIGNVKEQVKSDIKINNEIIEKVKQYKYLGVIIDNKLNFKDNVTYICKKVAKKVGVMARTRRNLNFLSAVNIYKTIVSPHFDYCASILFASSEGDIDRLQKLQNRAMRVILKVSRYTSVKLMLETLAFMSVRQRIYYNSLIIVYKVKYHLMPSYLSSIVSFVSQQHDHNVRSKDDFRIPFFKKSASQRQIFCNGLNLFNRLPHEIKNETNLKIFKNKLSNYVKDFVKI